MTAQNLLLILICGLCFTTACSQKPVPATPSAAASLELDEIELPERFPAATGLSAKPKLVPVPNAKLAKASDKFFAVPNGLSYEQSLRNLVNEANSGKDPLRQGRVTELKLKFVQIEAFAMKAFLFEDINRSTTKGYIRQYIFIHLGQGSNIHSYIARANTLILPPVPLLTISKGPFTDSGQAFHIGITALNAIDAATKKVCAGEGLKRASGLTTLASMDCENLVAPH